MLSTVDTTTSGHAAMVKDLTVSTGITVSRLHSGDYAVVVHVGGRQTIVDLSRSEFRQLLEQIASAFPEVGVACS